MEYTPQELKDLLEAVDCAGLEILIETAFADHIEKLTGAHIAHQQRYTTPEECRGKADVAVSYGGDGTFLDCVRMLGRYGIPVLGINSGRLGFLANVPKEGMRQAFDDLKRGRYSKEPRTLIQAEGDFPQIPEYPYAFNEFSIQRGRTDMISIEAYINDEMVATYWGDGLIFSTPAGSTAYALSVGGPVVAPGCACFVIAPIAPHNLTMRPVVIPDDSAVTFRIAARDSYAYVTLDNVNYEVADGAVFRVSKSKNPVFLVKLQNISFYDTLRNKMLWGFDRRDESKR